MALTMTEIQALSDDVWLPGSQDIWSRGNVLLYKCLKKVQKIGSCEKIRAILEYARARGGPAGATTRYNTAKKRTQNAARFPWAYFWSGASIDIDDEVKVSGGDQEIDIVFTKLDNMQRSIRDYMGDSMWATAHASRTAFGAEVEPFYGIPDLMDQNTLADGTEYGDIAVADLGTNLWLSYQNTDALSMNFATAQILRRGCSVNNSTGGKPDLYITTELLKDAFENSLQAAQRHTNPELVQAGFENIQVGTAAAMVADDKCPANAVNGFNFNYLYFKAHKDLFFAGPKWKAPTDQHVKTSQIEIASCFLTTQRAAQGQLTNVT